jgi:hypothetical protein
MQNICLESWEVCIGIECESFEELKEMNVMIPEIHEKMWTEKDRLGYKGVVYANVSDYKLIELLDKYDIYYIGRFNEDNEFDQMYKESMEEKINESRGIENINIT